MSLPRVTIVMTTYFPDDPHAAALRVDAACAAVASWARNLRYDGELAMHIADDGSTTNLFGFARARGEWDAASDRQLAGISYTQQSRHGVGASLNSGFAQAHMDGGIALYLVDDWKLLAPLDITPWVQLLEAEPTVGMVRLGPPHPWLSGRVEMFKSGWGLRLARHHFAFGHRPALYHRRMIEHWGPFDEDVNAYDCERLYAERWAANDRKGSWPQTDAGYSIPREDLPWPGNEGPGIVLALPTLWEHIDSIELADIEPRA